MSQKISLVLTGGGARGAYQAGVLYGMSEILPSDDFPFPIITGISAGSINAAFLACCSGSFKDSTKRLFEIWHDLESQDVFMQNKSGLASVAVRALINIFMGNIVRPKWPDSLLDNSPLKKLLEKNIDVHAIEKRIENGDLDAVCFSATDFNLKATTCFFEAHSKVDPWVSHQRLGKRVRLGTEHVMASSAIPAIFKLVNIDGSYYGDGSTRVAFPIAPAVRLGAEKILSIDMRYPQHILDRQKLKQEEYPELGEIFASLLDSIFSDSLDRDIERLDLVNDLVKNGVQEGQRWRYIPSMLIRPSQDLGLMAADIYQELSPSLRQLLKVFGIDEKRGFDMISHLAFESVYTKRLLTLGRSDALNRKQEILHFFDSP